MMRIRPGRSWCILAISGLLGCRSGDSAGTDDVEETVCSMDMDLVEFVASQLPDGTLVLTEGGLCGLECQCAEPPVNYACDWEVRGVPAEPGLYALGGDVEAICIDCSFEMGEVGPDDSMGKVEIVSLDSDGVVGCAIDTCSGSFRFTAPWCPE